MSNTDQSELDKFAALADQWWNPQGDMQPLHDINPERLAYVDQRAPLDGSRVLDVGCGAGLLTEAMAAAGATATGIDLNEPLLEAGRVHARQTGVSVDYHCVTTRDYANDHVGAFDTVICMEMLEHVPEPAVIVDDCARLLRPGGMAFFSTINRSPKAWLMAIAGAEYVLGLLPQGTHDYNKLIKPSQLSTWVRHAGLDTHEIVGMRYNPFLHTASIGGRPDVNYFIHASKGDSQ